MKRPELSRRDRRALLVGLGGLTLILAAFRGVPAWLEWRDGAHHDAVEMGVTARRMERAVARLPVTADTLEVRRERLRELGPHLLPGETVTGANARLAGIVAEAARESGLRVKSVRLISDTAHAGGLTTVGVAADLEGDVRGLAGLLRRLETGERLLSIRRLSVSQPEVAGPADRPERLRIGLTVRGVAWIRAEAESS